MFSAHFPAGTATGSTFVFESIHVLEEQPTVTRKTGQGAANTVLSKGE